MKGVRTIHDQEEQPRRRPTTEEELRLSRELKYVRDRIALIQQLHVRYAGLSFCAECNHAYPCGTIRALELA